MISDCNPRSLKIGLVQCLPVLGNPEANLDALARTLGDYPTADIMVWPELYLSGYTTASTAALAESLDGQRIRRLSQLAVTHDTALVIGLAEACGEQTANSALAIDRDGQVSGCYRKIQLFGDEVDSFTAGDELRVVSLCGVKVGLMICFDIEFPEIARALAEGGASMFLSISANMIPFAPDHRLCMRARALENRRPHVYVNQVGQGENFFFTGDSAVADAAGQVVTDCGSETCAVRLVDISLAVETTSRPDYLALRPRDLPPVAQGF